MGDGIITEGIIRSMWKRSDDVWFSEGDWVRIKFAAQEEKGITKGSIYQLLSVGPGYCYVTNDLDEKTNLSIYDVEIYKR